MTTGNGIDYGMRRPRKRHPVGEFAMNLLDEFATNLLDEFAAITIGAEQRSPFLSGLRRE